MFRENNKADLFVDNGRFPEIAEVKKHISDVLQEIQDHRREIRLALRQPSLDYTTVMQTEVKYCYLVVFFVLSYILLAEVLCQKQSF